MNNNIEKLRGELGQRVFDQGFHWKILFIGRSVNGTTDIVSSLSRSLRNLGHHVLDLDLKRHRVTENPDRVSGGMGPIFVRYDAIKETVAHFKPQLIVTCAGGLTFTPEDAAALKARGIVLVGLTLSDPDVFPTVHGHARVFDLHTTNAAASLDMYEAAGVHNTVYFPFGIDRGFVTQEVPSDAKYDADVICLGHANNRPDRNSMMSGLAEQFKVRTYGRGWEVPGSEVVAGEQMLQALKAGRIHVNFPLTRAGYINIKCGVFESAGAGALVATGKFDEMSEFFTYGEEIIGYEDKEDLARQIRWLLDNPDECSRITENGFKRVINDHLYEHRWMSLLDRLRSVSSTTTPWLSEERRDTIRTTLSLTYPRAKKVILSGFYGASNLGDELILRSISDSLMAADPAVQITVAAENPTNVESAHGLQAYKRSDHAESLNQVRTASAVVVGGGGLWHDYTFERAGGLLSLFNGATISMAGFGILPMLGRMLHRPYHVVGLGVGPLENTDAKAMVRFLADQTSSLYVRDQDSALALESAGVRDDKVTVGPDVVYGVKLPDDIEIPGSIRELVDSGHTLIGVNLRPWAAYDMDTLLSELKEAIKQYSAGRKVAVVGIPMQAGATVDSNILTLLFQTLPVEIPSVVLDAPLTLEQLLGCYSQLNFLVAMRLHASLIAHRAGIPVVGLGYDPKVTQHFAEIGREHLCHELTVSASELASSFEKVNDENRSIPPNTLLQLRRLEEGAREALSVVATSVAELPIPEVIYEIPSMPAAVTPRSTTHEKPPVRPSAAAQFSDSVATCLDLEKPERRLGQFYSMSNALQLFLPTTRPRRGQELRFDGFLDTRSQGPVEISFRLSNRYQRPQNLGRVFLELAVGDFVFRDDLARSKNATFIKVHLMTGGRTPISYRLTVERDCFEAKSWPVLSRASLRILGAHSLPEIHEPQMFANAGAIESFRA